MDVSAFLKEFKRARKESGDSVPLGGEESAGAAGVTNAFSQNATKTIGRISSPDDSGESEQSISDREAEDAPPSYLRSKRQRCDAFWRRTQEGGLGRTRECFTEIKTYRTNRCLKTDSSIPNATVRRATHYIPLRVAAKRGGASTVNKLRDELLRKKNSLSQSLVVREHTGGCFADDSRECALSTGAEDFLVYVDDLIAPENTAMDQSPFLVEDRAAQLQAKNEGDVATATPKYSMEEQQSSFLPPPPPVEVEVRHEKPRTERVSLFARAKIYSGATAPVVNRESEVLNTRKFLE
ncbi:hypothetical protein BCY84_17783 [Trypanosoma cruzi cruzi]|uniref:Uncharacterized protein n=1 Tax=Trypanosoma cruzi TaxID=5693 RepID=A0A2V2UKF0_TRYCR|nr:hypothetical protein BCY84_17783 [Trypanosoma cruzi cruzi]PWU84531.1 hypothetical protein C4B63_220g25 [Trypanosoma cruzi]